MFFYDAFSFIQVTFMLFIVIGLGMSAPALPATGVRRTATTSGSAAAATHSELRQPAARIACSRGAGAGTHPVPCERSERLRAAFPRYLREERGTWRLPPDAAIRLPALDVPLEAGGDGVGRGRAHAQPARVV